MDLLCEVRTEKLSRILSVKLRYPNDLSVAAVVILCGDVDMGRAWNQTCLQERLSFVADPARLLRS